MSHADVLTVPMLGDRLAIVKVFVTRVRKRLNKRRREQKRCHHKAAGCEGAGLSLVGKTSNHPTPPRKVGAHGGFEGER